MFSYLKQGRGFYGEIVRLSLPIVLQNLVTSCLALFDTFMVGVLGEAQMAAVTLANIPIFVMQLLVFGLQSGSSVLISQYWGKRDEESINRVLGVGLYIAAGASSLFALALFLAPVQITGLFTSNAELAVIGGEYARIVGVSYIFNSINMLYIAAHRSMENPKLGMFVLSTSMLFDTFLNWVFIFGKLGFPAMGVAGAALSTVFARMLETAMLAAYALKNKRFHLRLRALLRPGGEILRSFIKYSTPVVINESVWSIGFSMYPTIMGYMDGNTEILAAYTISGNIEKICTVMVFAIAATAATVVGREIGAGRADTVYEKAAAMNAVSLGMGAAVGGLMILAVQFAFPRWLYPLFDLSAEAKAISAMMLTMTFAMLAVRAYNCNIIVGVLRGGGDVHAATLIDTVPLWAVAIPLAALCGLVWKAGIFWVYIVIQLDSLLKFIFGGRRFRSRQWIHDVTQISYQKET